MEKIYVPEKIERRNYQKALDKGLFRLKNNDKDGYCIILPPPNVTGTLHMGHAFQSTVMDCLIRYHRMLGFDALWQLGIDHAGIATQMVVERQLEAQNQTRQSLGRRKFIDKVWEWKEQSGGMIQKQLCRLGASFDWSRERFTLDPDMSRVVTKVFIDLYEKSLIYRGKKLVNWDPVLQTAVSDLEVLSQEENGHLWYIRYPAKNSNDSVVVATTRPETMFGDTAVMAHPDDIRYQKFIGKTIALPLTEREIPVIGDSYVDPEFGSGCVKITPAHDFNDYIIGQRHELPLINIMNPDASLNGAVPVAYRGLNRIAARKKVLKDLAEQNLLVKTEQRRIMIPRGDRSGEIIEPLLTDQWFVKVEPLAEKACDAVKNGAIRFVPKHWEKTYFEWMNRIQDWCISRQLWWGHRIPAWYDDQGNCYVGESEEQVRANNHLHSNMSLRQDEDVLDTWFSSALWPFSTLGWPEETDEMKRFYPTSVLVTGFDIIFFWVARMIMLGLECTGKAPFKQVYVHGLILDSEGKKMSKSKGNTLDPIDLIDGISLDDLLRKRLSALMQPHMREHAEKKTRQQFPNGIPAYGTDALRLSFMAMANNNRDIRFEFKRIEGYRNFCNKLWNAARYVVTNCVETQQASSSSNEPVDLWIRYQMEKLTQDLTKCFSDYRFDLATHALYEFVWHDYCDWYLEFCKVIQSSDNARAKKVNQHCQVQTLEAILRFLHPFIPFLTEELWQELKREGPIGNIGEEFLQQRPYPTEKEFRSLRNNIGEIEPKLGTEKTNHSQPHRLTEEVIWLKEFIGHIRRIRSTMNISPAAKIPLKLQFHTQKDQSYFNQYQEFIVQLAKLDFDRIRWLDERAPPPTAAIAVHHKLHILVPAKNLIDIDAEIKRLEKEITKIRKNLNSTRKRLASQNFIDHAAIEVIERTRQQADTLATQHVALKKQLIGMKQ